MFIRTEDTPNPRVIKFVPGKPVMLEGTYEVTNSTQAQGTALARDLMSITGVESLFFGSDFISVTRREDVEWPVINPSIFAAIMQFYAHHQAVEIAVDAQQSPVNHEDPVVQSIIDIIDSHIRPAVAQDGGDIIFDHFKDGTVYVKLQGACSGCPSSSLTLKSGIENMLRHYVPQVQMVEAI